VALNGVKASIALLHVGVKCTSLYHSGVMEGIDAVLSNTASTHYTIKYTTKRISEDADKNWCSVLR
jgi:hypothetical protein